MRALIATLGSLGDVHPFLALAAVLKARGHEVVVATPERYRDLVLSDGLQHRALRPDMGPDRYTSARVLEPGRAFRIDIDYFLRHLSDTFDDLLSLCEGAHVLISPPLVIPSLLIAANRRVRWVDAVPAPPFSLTAALPHELQYLDAAPSPEESERQLRRRAAAGLLALCHARGIAISAMRARPDLRLYLFPEWLVGGRPDWPQQGSAAVGFCFREGKIEQLSPALRRFLADGKRPIMLTLGSTAVHAVGPDFYETAAFVMRRLGRAAIFLTGPSRIELPDSLPSGAEIVAEAFAPVRPLFRQASVVVHHGGIGTIGEALRAGVPQLAIPFAFDQPYNAVLVSALGVGRLLAPRDYGAEALEKAIAPLLHEAAYGDQARQLAHRVEAEDGAKAACERIEAMVEG